jgi:hypothetical protein
VQRVRHERRVQAARHAEAAGCPAGHVAQRFAQGNYQRPRTAVIDCVRTLSVMRRAPVSKAPAAGFWLSPLAPPLATLGFAAAPLGQGRWIDNLDSGMPRSYSGIGVPGMPRSYSKRHVRV